MSYLKDGRPKKRFTDKITFDILRFAETLARFSDEDFSKWSLKKEWVTFSKIYFSCKKNKG